MKAILVLPAALVMAAAVVPASAQKATETTEKTETTEHADGSVTEKNTTTTRTFNPDVEKRVVRYFDTYKTERYGLPPAVVTRVKAREIPSAWRTTRIGPGVVIQAKDRPYLLEAPPELVKVLPAPTEEVRYYVAGSNVVAVDRKYRIVDSVHIPSIKIAVEAD
jgi:hypothetical protein